MTQTIQTDRIRGIGPVIAGRVDGVPAYYMDVVDADGIVRRCWEPKTCPRGDRLAKRRCVLDRIELAQACRGQGQPVVLAHDQQSFDGLVKILVGREVPGGAPAERVNFRSHRVGVPT